MMDKEQTLEDSMTLTTGLESEIQKSIVIMPKVGYGVVNREMKENSMFWTRSYVGQKC